MNAARGLHPVGPERNEPAELCLIYLSGSVKKGDRDLRDPAQFWSAEDECRLIQEVQARQVQTLNPSKSNLRRSDFYANFGCDLHLVDISNVVLADLRAKRGIGIGAEMMFAQLRGITVVSICPANSDYRRDLVPNVFGEDLVDWIHPFAFGLSDHIVEDLDEAILVLNKLLSEGGLERTGPKKVDSATDYYNRIRETFERE